MATTLRLRSGPTDLTTVVVDVSGLQLVICNVFGSVMAKFQLHWLLSIPSLIIDCSVCEAPTCGRPGSKVAALVLPALLIAVKSGALVALLNFHEKLKGSESLSVALAVNT